MRINRNSSRRDFLRFGASAVGAAAAFGPAGLLCQRASAQNTTDYKALVCIFQYGGNDANNMLIPNGAAGTSYPYSDYQTVRQNLAIAQNSLVSIYDSASKQNFGLHPSLAPLGALYAPATGAPRLALVANVGPLVKPIPKKNGKPDLSVTLPSNLYSHSDQQSEWQNAVAAPATLSSTNPRAASSGWAGRLIDRVAPAAKFPAGIGINGGALQLVGIDSQPTTVGGDSFNVANQDPDNALGLQQMLQLPSQVKLIQAAQSSTRAAVDVAKTIDALLADTSAIQAQFPGSDLGQQLAQVASIMAVAPTGLGASRQIFFCSQGGYDTHSAQAGTHAALLTELAQAMAAFDTWLQTAGLGNKVVTFTESDFNRTFQPNGNIGTDHAWGSHVAVMGPVKAARIYGTFPTLKLQGPDDAGDRGAWAPSTSSDQYEGELAKWFGLQSNADLDYVFPNLKTFNYDTKGFLVG